MRGKQSYTLALLLFFSALSVADPKLPTNSKISLARKVKTLCEGALDGELLSQAHEKWSGKTVILDTYVLLYDPYAIYKYPGATIVLPMMVLDEIHKHSRQEESRFVDAAKTFLELYAQIEEQSDGFQFDLPFDAKLVLNAEDHISALNDTTLKERTKENYLIALGIKLKEKSGAGNVFLITNEITTRSRARILSLKAHAHEFAWVAPDPNDRPLYIDLEVSDEEFTAFMETGSIPIPEDLPIAPNEFVRLKTKNQEGSDESVARYVYNRENPADSTLNALFDFSQFGLALGPKNLEQKMALDVAMDKSVDMVILMAEAGAGKSWVALMAGLVQTLRQSSAYAYSRLMLTRPLVDVGRQNPLGPVPGDLKDKMEEDFRAFYDNLERLWPIVRQLRVNKTPTVAKVPRDPATMSARKRSKLENYQARQAEVDKAMDETLEARTSAPVKPKIEVPSVQPFDPLSVPNLVLLPLAKIRGRSLHYTVVIGDEIQNISIHELKSLLTRVAEGTKIFILGDATQIDPQYLTPRNNGLSVATSLFTGPWMTDEERSRVAVITMKNVVRSEFAKMVTRGFRQIDER